jgi:very-short-patch-repair endonuclease
MPSPTAAPRYRADLRIVEIANRQHGLVTREQLRACGLSDAAIARRVRSGHLHRIHRGIYSVGYPVIATRARWLAAVLLGGPGSALGSTQAAQNWEISRYAHTKIVVITANQHHDVSGVSFHRTATLSRRDVRMHGGIPTTTVARTALDLGEVLSPFQLANVLHEAAFRHRLNERELDDVMRRNLGRRHAMAVLREARALNRAGSAGTASALEDAALESLHAAGLRAPEVNVKLAAVSDTARFDLVWRDRKLVVEVDGPGHARARTKAADRDRDRRLMEAGFSVVRWTGADQRLLVEAVGQSLAEPSLRPTRIMVP